MFRLFKRLFRVKKSAEQVFTGAPAKVPPPLSQIGRLDSRCPYCETELPERPKAKTRCKSCGNSIRVRWDAEGRSTLLRDDQIGVFSEQKYSSPKYAGFREAVEDLTIIPFTGEAEKSKAPMLAKVRQLAEQYADITDKSAFADFAVAHFGARYESLVDAVALQFSISPARATLILRHIGSVQSALYHQLRYQRVSLKYKWSTSHDERVCTRCQALNGKVFFWDNPPEGGHPGECECWRFICPDYAAVPAGRLDSRCPNCEVELAKRPRGKTKCKNCQKEIWVRTNSGGQQVLLSEKMLVNFDRQKYGPEVCRCIAKPIIELGGREIG
jgi:hypothetical protein